MPEFIFNKGCFLKKGGFVSFQMAMRTDNATVIQCGYERGIKTINGHNTKVLWRDSGENISSKSNSKIKNIINYSTLIDFFNWMQTFCNKNKIGFQ